MVHSVVPEGAQWSQVLDPQGFKWTPGVTPFSSLTIILATWSLYFSGILFLKFYMRNRPPFALRTATALHNLFLCGASAAICVGVVREVYRRATTRGVDEIFCTADPDSLDGPLSWYLYLYYLTKFYELADTFILVLKKKPLIFLHWYHHAIVILMVWSWIHYGIVFSALGTIANTGVHVFMYYYYFRSSLGGRVWFKRYLTALQIVQFGTSFVLAAPYVYYHFQKGCVGGPAFVGSMLVNFSFLLLFVQFYKGAYSSRSSKTKQVKEL
ncbi:hypothetical protein HDU89_007882 [Geranomyces variabilis]|nr:hypothetical protein HDU89_007882 [Geranomyces variabilis]